MFEDYNKILWDSLSFTMATQLQEHPRIRSKTKELKLRWYNYGTSLKKACYCLCIKTYMWMPWKWSLP